MSSFEFDEIDMISEAPATSLSLDDVLNKFDVDFGKELDSYVVEDDLSFDDVSDFEAEPVVPLAVVTAPEKPNIRSIIKSGIEKIFFLHEFEYEGSQSIQDYESLLALGVIDKDLAISRYWKYLLAAILDAVAYSWKSSTNKDQYIDAEAVTAGLWSWLKLDSKIDPLEEYQPLYILEIYLLLGSWGIVPQKIKNARNSINLIGMESIGNGEAITKKNAPLPFIVRDIKHANLTLCAYRALAVIHVVLVQIAENYTNIMDTQTIEIINSNIDRFIKSNCKDVEILGRREALYRYALSK